MNMRTLHHCVVVMLFLAGLAKPCSEPGTPNHERATAVSPTSIRLDWNNTASESNLYFDIEGQSDPSVGNVGPFNPGLNRLVSHTVNGLTTNRQHCFRIWARVGFNGCRSQQPSAWACATPRQDTGAANVLTQHNDNFRTGAYLAETTLTPKTVLARGMQVKYVVLSCGPLGTLDDKCLEGSIVAQPLYVRDVGFADRNANALFVATDANMVYAMEADTGKRRWKHFLIDSDPNHRPIGRGVYTTPVIDIEHGQMYVLFGTRIMGENVDPRQPFEIDVAYWLVALSLGDGTELGRVRVAGSVKRRDGTRLDFVEKYQFDHPALLLDHGLIYISFGSIAGAESTFPYHGWVMQYRASDLVLRNVFCTSANERMGSGIWQGGGGLAADPDGNVYFLTGNGRAAPEPPQNSFGDSFIKLTPSVLSPTAYVPHVPLLDDKGGTLKDAALQMDIGDADLGAGGAMVIPGFKLALGGGKTGYMYVVHTDSMKLSQWFTASNNLFDYNLRAQDFDSGPHLHGSPTFWRGPDANYSFLYVWGEKDVLRMYRFNRITQRIEEPLVHIGTVRALSNAMPGGMLSISANGNTDGIVWATLPIKNFPEPIPGRLYAFNAYTLEPLWDYKPPYGVRANWPPPTIADGKVFVAAKDPGPHLVVFELGPDVNSGRQSFAPDQPAGIGGCVPCHPQGRPPNFKALHERYPDEASVRALPARALDILAPPPGHRKILVLEGNGLQIYEAKESPAARGKFVWNLKGSTADLVEVRPALGGSENSYKPIKVRLSLGSVWSAADGSTMVGSVEKTTPAPERTDTAWTLFKVIKSSGRGILTNSYIQCVYTHAGLAPATPPKQSGQVTQVPFVAQYWLYQ